MIYIICFAISTLLIWLGTRKTNIKNYNNSFRLRNKCRIIPVSLGLLFPILLATFRDTTVGVDVEYYVVPYFNRACISDSFGGYISLLGNGKDFGYYLLNYLVSRWTNDIRWLFFWTESIIICFVFAGCWRFRERALPWQSMLFYYLTFYNMNYSTVRQSCACAISFYALSIAFTGILTNNKTDARRNSIRILLLLLIALTFHTTSIVMVLILIVCYFMLKGKLNPKRFAICGGIIIALLRLFSNRLLGLTRTIATLITPKYAKDFFINSNNTGAGGYSSIILMGIIVLLMQIIISKREMNKDWKGIENTLVGLNAIYIAGMLFLTNLMFIPRILYYIQMLWNITLAQAYKGIPVKRKDRKFVVLLTIAIVLAYYLFFYIISGVHGTYPYVLYSK